jgi:drug/metabolite transporter (DMT)-like permease
MPQPIHRTMTAAEWGLLVTLSILWAGSFFYIGVTVQALPPLSIVAFRVAVGGALLYAVVRLTGGPMPTDWKTWRAFATMGVLNNVVPFSLIAWGQGYIASGLASILNATTPLFTLVIAHYLTHDERMNPARVAGLIIGFIGVVVLIGFDALAGAGEHLLPELAVLLASAFYAMSAIFGRRFARMGLPPLTTATGQIGSAAVWRRSSPTSSFTASSQPPGR